MMRILHWDEAFHPDFGYQINVLAKMQARQGHDVTIMTAEKVEDHPLFKDFAVREELQEKDDLYAARYGVEVVRLPIYGVVSSRVIYKPGFLRRIKGHEADVLMCHGNDSLSAMTIALRHKYLNLPIIFDSHMLSMASRNPLSPLFQLFYRRVFSPSVSKNRWLVIRTQDDDYVNSKLGISPELTPYVSFGADGSLFHPDQQARVEKRRELGVSDDDFLIVYAGKLTEAKGGLFLAQTFLERFSSRRPVTLMVIGNSPEGEYGRQVDVALLASKNKVLRFPTQLYVDLNRFYQAADLAIFPKQCSLSFFDVQACGLPVVFEDNNINRDRSRHNNALVFSAGDVADFRAKVSDVAMMSPGEYEMMAQNGYRHVKDNFDYADISAKYTELMVETVERFRSR